MRSIQAGSWTRSILRSRRSRRLDASRSASATRRPRWSTASLVRGSSTDPDVFVESDAIGFYHLVVNRQTEGVRIEGDFEVLERLIDAFGPKPATPEPLLA